VSSGIKALIQSVHNGKHAPIRVIHNGLDHTAFGHQRDTQVQDRTVIRDQLGITREKLILFCGRLSPQKGILELIDSAAQLIHRHPESIYVIAGQYDQAQYANDVARAMKRYLLPAHKLRFIGKQSRQAVLRLCHGADLAVMPSLYEGLPYSALEVMAMGVPIVATNTCGLSDLVVDRESGLLVPIREKPNQTGDILYRTKTIDCPGFTNAQLELLMSDNLARQLGAAGQMRVLSRFNIKGMIDSTLELYEAIWQR
jgi:glycosyltransferase involved in cell wall biosynthesis